MFKQGFSCPVLLVRMFSSTSNISYTGLSPSIVKLPNLFYYIISYIIPGSSHFARHYYGNLN
jgi:hypothetical protein